MSNVFVKFFVKILRGGVPMGLKTQKYHVFSVQKYHFGGGCPYFSLKHKSTKYTFVQQEVGGSRRDPKHKSMYKCAYMYVHLYILLCFGSPRDPPTSCCTKVYFLLLCVREKYGHCYSAQFMVVLV